MPAMPARNLHPIAMLQSAPLKCGLKLQRINRATVVVARIPGFTAYVIGWARLDSCFRFVPYSDHLKGSAGKM